jgi:endonuclease/exonuclease/phosphatase family metal-dependent hydrolase
MIKLLQRVEPAVTKGQKFNVAVTIIGLLTMVVVLGACAGHLSQARDHSTPGQRFRVITYNIALGHMLETRDPSLLRLSRDAHSIRAALARHPSLRDFDILGLQEVCSDNDDLARIRREVHVYFGRADPNREGECRKGQALLSPHPILAGGTIVLPNIRRVGRSAIWVDVQVPGYPQPLRVYNVHLENRGDGSARTQQTITVLEHAMAWRATHPEAPLLVLGDFNSVGNRMNPRGKEPCIVYMESYLRSALPHQVITHILEYQTDWIFFSGLSLRRARVVPIVLSDHYPVVADFLISIP